MTTDRNDFDSPWKEIIETYFEEFIAFFFPQTHSDIDWQRGYEFLFKTKLWGCENTFHFPIVKLLDYSQQWDDLEISHNPFATVVMAHLKTLETRNDVSARQQWKLSLAKRLYQKGYERQDVINLFRFIDWLVVLPEDLENVFWREISTYQEENRMQYVMSIERIAEKRGREQGIEQGIEQGKAMIVRLLIRKLGDLSPETTEQIQALSISQLNSLVETLLEFVTLEDLTDWLSHLQQLKVDGLRALTKKFGPLPDTLSTQVAELSLESLTALATESSTLVTVEALQSWLAYQTQSSDRSSSSGSF
jgi:predicted DNA-binding ribbon-helix-helix protein